MPPPPGLNGDIAPRPHLHLRTFTFTLSPHQVHDGTLFVNGEPRTEPFINEKPGYILAKLTIPPGDVSCMGEGPPKCGRLHTYGSRAVFIIRVRW